ncbi:hypothetical protein ONZ45_g18942 [Pleurotus djamor]|nr:hypothetical protein ONZ45_g18942 [Pleurotus djamor]
MSFFRLQVALGLLVAFHAFFVNALSSTLQEVTNFGANPTGVRMFLYKPTALANPPPLIIASHYCTGTAQAYFQGTQYAQLADNHGFIVIYPHAPDSGGCWDVHSSGTLTHDGGGDSLAIASMVRYAISNYGVDASRVFATGTSSGAMMTNVLLGAYPDLFKAGSLFAGVPYGCFEGPGMWNSQCSQGQLIKTPQQWGDQARSGYPGFTGQRPKVQFWHGTQDEILNAQNFQEQIKQWTNVFGVSQTPTSTETNSPVSILAQGVPHNIPAQVPQAHQAHLPEARLPATLPLELSRTGANVVGKDGLEAPFASHLGPVKYQTHGNPPPNYSAMSFFGTPAAPAPVGISNSTNVDKDIEVADPPTDSISSLSFSGAADFLAVGSWDNNVRIYEVGPSGQTQGKAMYSHQGPVLSVCWNKCRMGTKYCLGEPTTQGACSMFRQGNLRKLRNMTRQSSA